MSNGHKGKKILVIEDEADLRKVLCRELSRNEFKTIEAENGATGLETALSEKPDLILLDIIMPVMDGLTMLEKLRAAGEWGKNVPVIILTNLSAENEGVMQKIARHEPSFYMVKVKWQMHEVVEKIKERLSRPA